MAKLSWANEGPWGGGSGVLLHMLSICFLVFAIFRVPRPRDIPKGLWEVWEMKKSGFIAQIELLKAAA